MFDFDKENNKIYVISLLIGSILLIIASIPFIILKHSLFLDLQVKIACFFLQRPLKDPTKVMWLLFFFNIYISLLFLFISFYIVSSLKSFKITLFSLFISFIFITVFFILINADWQFGDDHMFLSSICIKKPFWMNQLSIGRLYISCFENNILLITPFYNNPLAFYVIVSLEYLVFSFFSFLSVKTELEQFPQNKLMVSFATLILLFLQFLSHDMFFALIYAEKLLLTLLSIFTYAIIKANTTNKLKYWIIAYIFAVFSTYCKEPMFGVFIVIAIYIYIFTKKDNKNAKYFAIALILNAVIFLILYYHFSLKNIESFYTGWNTSLSRFNVLKQIVNNQKMILIVFFLAVFVLVKIIKQLKNKHFIPIIEDALLFSALAYATAIFLLRFYQGYYFLPCFILAFPAFLHYSFKIVENKSKFLHRLCFLLMLIILFPYVYSYSWRCLYKLNYGHKTMNQLNQIALIAKERNSKFLWYDEGSLNDVQQRYYYTILPMFINYINNNQDFSLAAIETLPETITDDVFVISIESIPMYENDSFSKLPIDLFNVYSIQNTEDKRE